MPDTRTTIPTTGTLIVTSCWCGVQLAIPKNMFDWASGNPGRAVHCPVGHEFVYRDTELKAEKNKRERAESDAAFWRKATRDANERTAQERRTNAALKGHLTRYRKRIANGVCPVAGCHRHFPNVQAHVATQHADWLVEHPEVFDG